MASLRSKHFDTVVRMLSTAEAGPSSSSGEGSYKVLVLDRFCLDMVSPLVKVQELRKHGVTLHLLLEASREPIAGVPAVYLCQPTEANVARIGADIGAGLYDSYELNFTSSLPRALLERLANEAVRADASDRVRRVFDQYAEFVSLEPRMFSLAQPRAYVSLNDPTARDSEVESAVAGVVSGLFCVLATAQAVPVIRCPKGGAAEMVARELEGRLRDHLAQRNNLFAEATSFARPMLCIFDRNYELATAVQHVWTYQPLVHDALQMRLNRVSIAGDAKGGAAAGAGAKKSYELDVELDPFWSANGAAQFPKVAEEVESELQQYKQAVEEVNRKTELGDDSDAAVTTNTQNLMSAVSSLPQLQERKRVVDKHTNIATALLSQIKARGLDAYYQVEEDLITAKADKAAMLELLQDATKGTPEDKVRLALVYALACEAPPTAAELADVEAALQAAGADVAALRYVQKMRSLSAGMSSAQAGAAGGKDQGNLLEWADKLYGQSINAMTKGMKSLLSGGHTLAVTRAVEGLMEGKPGASPEAEQFAWLDPQAPRGSGPPPADKPRPFRDAFVFVVGGGSLVEHQSLQEMAAKAPGRSVVYGSTELLPGSELVQQLAELGRKSGAAAP